MNRLIYAELPEADREEIRLALRDQAFGFHCSCGEAKRPHMWFCDLCIEKLRQSGLHGDLYHGIHEQRYFSGAYEFFPFDRLIDALAALKSGRWDGRKHRRSAEAGAA